MITLTIMTTLMMMYVSVTDLRCVDSQLVVKPFQWRSAWRRQRTEKEHPSRRATQAHNTWSTRGYWLVVKATSTKQRPSVDNRWTGRTYTNNNTAG